MVGYIKHKGTFVNVNLNVNDTVNVRSRRNNRAQETEQPGPSMWRQGQRLCVFGSNIILEI